MTIPSRVGLASHAPLDVVLVATLRPALLDLCLHTFSKYFLKGRPFRLICNIDPIGEKISHKAVVNVCKKYFAEAIFRTPASPSFSSAVFWCWSQVRSDIFFHLEEDWIMLRPVNLANLISNFSDKNIEGVRFSLKKNHRAGFQIDKKIYSLKFSLNPSMFRLSLIHDFLKLASLDEDPEKQFYNYYDELAASGSPPIIFWGDSKSGPFVADTGKKWRKNYGIAKFSAINSPQNPGLLNSDVWTVVKHSRIVAIRNWLNYKFFMLWWSLRHQKYS